MSSVGSGDAIPSSCCWVVSTSPVHWLWRLYFTFPATSTSTLVFAAVMGSLWLGVVPLVNGLVAQLFGLRFMATLTGIAFLSHQVGSFIGAWGGGLIYDHLGSYDVAWKGAVIIGLIAGSFQMMMNTRPPKAKEDDWRGLAHCGLTLRGG